MSTQLVLGVVGGAIGGYFGGPQGAAAGFALGSALGGAVAPRPPAAAGPRLDDLRITGTEYGLGIPWVSGSPRIAGQIWWASDRREISHSQSAGKGGGQTATSFTYEVDLLIGLTDGAIAGVTRIWNNGKLIWTNLEVATDQSRIDSQGTEVWSSLTIYTGSASQMPDPTYEAAVGLANAPAYRGRSYVVIQKLNLGSSGQIPNLTFEVCSSLAPSPNIVRRQAISNTGYQFQDAIATYLGRPAIVSMQPEVRVAVISASINSVYEFDIAGSFRALSTRTGSSEAFPGPANFGYPVGLIDSQPVRWQNGNVASGSAAHRLLPIGTQNDTGSEIVAGADLAAVIATGRFVGGVAMCSDGQHAVIFSAPTSAMPGAAVVDQWHLVLRQSGTTSLIKQGALETSASIYAFGFGNGTTYHFGCVMLEDNLQHVWVAYTPAGEVRMYRIDDDNVLRQKALLGSSTGGNGITSGNTFQFPSIWAQAGYCVIVSGKSFSAFARSGDSITTVSLSSTVQALCNRAGLSAAQIDVTGLASITKPVRALAMSQAGTTRGVLEQLQTAFQFEAVLSDKIYFKPRGGASVVTIPYADLGAGSGHAQAQPLALTVSSDLELPPQVSVQYRNMLADQQTASEYSDRLIAGQAAITTVQLAMGLLPTEAKAVADAIVADQLASLVTTSLNLSLQYAYLEPTDVVQATDAAGNLHRLRLVTRRDAAGVLSFDAVADDSRAVVSAGTTDSTYTQGITVTALADTVLYPLDIPQLRDSDDGAGFYVAARGSNTNWPGAAVVISADNVTFAAAATVAEAAVLGTCSTVLGDWTGAIVLDEVNAVTVSVADGSLSSVTRTALLADQSVNVMVIGAEVIRFCTATLLSASPNVYTLTRLLRGQRGTEWASTGHVASERAVLLRPQGLRRVTQQATERNVQRYLKGVTMGRSVAAAAAQTFSNAGVSQRPLAPVNLRAARQANGDVVFSWSRRTRSINATFCGPAGVAVPLAESAEAYSVALYVDSSYAIPAQTFDVTGPAATYTLAQQQLGFTTGVAIFALGIYYFRVWQKGAINGYVAQQPLPVAAYDPGAAPPPAQAGKPRIRAFFWYDFASNTSSFVSSVADYGGATATPALTTQAPTGRWLASINPANSLLQGSPLSYFTGSGMAASTLSTASRVAIVEYDSATGGYFALVPDAGTGPYREYTIDSAGVATAGSYITVDGAVSYNYSYLSPILVKFGGVWRAFEAGGNGGFSRYLQRTSAGTWATVITSMPLPLNPTPNWQSTVAGAAVLTVATVPTLFVVVLTYSLYHPQLTYATVYLTTDGSTLTQVATTYLDAQTQGVSAGYSRTKNQLMVVGGKLIYYHRRQNGTTDAVTGGNIDFYPGLFAWQSSTDGRTWTPQPVSLDSAYPIDINSVSRSFVATSSGVIGNVTTDNNTAIAKSKLIVSTDGVAFTSVSDAATWATGYANVAGDYVPMAGQSYADLRLPLAASGSLALFERALIQS